MEKSQSYKSCFVPSCTSTTIRTPNKIYFHVPEKKELRDLWFDAVGRTGESIRSTLYCCEDHFNLNEDMQNYHIYSLIGGRKRAKKGIVPHLNINKENERFSFTNYPLSSSEIMNSDVNQDLNLDDHTYPIKKPKINNFSETIVKEEVDISDCDKTNNVHSFDQIFFPETFDDSVSVKQESF